MTQIESAFIGYITGFLTGSLIILVVIGYFLFQSDEFKTPEEIQSIIETIRSNYYNPEQQIFITAFAIGFIMGLGGSKEAAQRA
jgi:hypothetical protein